MTIYVQKREKDKLEPVDFSKIERVIDWGRKGLNIDDDFKIKAKSVIINNIKTSDIQNYLINLAINQINKDNFIEKKDYVYFAARLQLLQLYKQAKHIIGYDKFGYGSYMGFMTKAIELKQYNNEIFDNFTVTELLRAEKFIKPERDFEFTFTGLNTFSSALSHYKGMKFELPQWRYLSMALIFVIGYEKHIEKFKSQNEKFDKIKEYYDRFSMQKIIPQRPVLINLGRCITTDGTQKGGNLSSCFIDETEDNLISIYYNLESTALISQAGGGSSNYLGKVRSKGASIRGIPNVGHGITAWMKLFNDTIISVDQLGSRTGAFTPGCPIYHADYEDVITSTVEDNGDIRTKSFDVFPQISVPDLYYERFYDDGLYTSFDPHEIKDKFGIELDEIYGDAHKEAYEFLEEHVDELELATSKQARKYLKHAINAFPQKGTPYIINYDHINRGNPNKHFGTIKMANLCVESYSVTSPTKILTKNYFDGEKLVSDIDQLGYSHVCNLISQVVCHIEDDEDLRINTEVCVELGEILINLSNYPTPETKHHSEDFRILGTTTLGWHDLFIKNNLMYHNAVDFASKMKERIAYHAINRSMELSKILGSYKWFEGSDWSKGVFFGKTLDQIKSISKNPDLNWESLVDFVVNNGIRHGGLLADAPNSSTAKTAGGVAPCILPIKLKFGIDGNDIYIPKFISNETFWMYKEQFTYDQKVIIDMCAAAQEWMDQGISMELYINYNDLEEGETFKASNIMDLILYAWSKKIKTIYYWRQTEKSKDDCISCAN